MPPKRNAIGLLIDTSGGSSASADDLEFTPTGDTESTTIQGAIVETRNELQSEIDSINNQSSMVVGFENGLL